MTVRINFLPRTHQPPKQLGTTQWTIAAAIVLAVATAAMYYGSIYAGTAQLVRDGQASQVKLQQVKAGLAQAADIKTREDKVASAESDLKSLVGRRWSSILLDLRESTPQHVTWTSVHVSGNTILLKGTNRGLVDAAQLLGSLVNNQEIDQVNLHYINEKGIPITISSKAAQDKEQKGPPGSGQTTPGSGGKAQSPVAPVTPAGTFYQLEFELEITLVDSEGGSSANGA